MSPKVWETGVSNTHPTWVQLQFVSPWLTVIKKTLKIYQCVHKAKLLSVWVKIQNSNSVFEALKAWLEILVSVSAVRFWYRNQQYRPFFLVVSTISGIASITSGHIDSIAIMPKYWYWAVFQTLSQSLPFMMFQKPKHPQTTP